MECGSFICLVYADPLRPMWPHENVAPTTLVACPTWHEKSTSVVGEATDRRIRLVRRMWGIAQVGATKNNT